MSCPGVARSRAGAGLVALGRGCGGTRDGGRPQAQAPIRKTLLV
jgi:hypothetical protein